MGKPLRQTLRIYFDFKKPNWRIQKSCGTERVQDLWLEHRVKVPRSGRILRHKSEQQNMTVIPAVPRSKKTRGASRGKALSPRLGFIAKVPVIIVLVKPKLSPYSI